jgi:hypothetical protein
MARTCRGLTAPTTSAPRHWNAESGQQQDLTPKDSERSHGPRRSANVGVSLRRVHERWGSQARDSGASQHWGAGAVPGPGFESGKRFFSRGVFTRPKREKESDGCSPPLHPPPSGMQAYAIRRSVHAAVNPPSVASPPTVTFFAGVAAAKLAREY